MKKKLIIFLAAVLLIALTAGGTYAYKSTSLETHNVISSGKGVKVELVDLDTGDLSTDAPSGSNRSVALPGDRSGGIYAAKNIGGSDAWVRLRLVPDAAPAAGVTAALDISKLSIMGSGEGWSEMDGEGWFYYTKPLKPGESSTAHSSALDLSSDMGNEWQGAKVSIKVELQAVQVANNGSTVFAANGWPES